MILKFNLRSLVEKFQSESSQNIYVENRTELMAIDVAKTERLLGLFADTHLMFDNERRNPIDCKPCQDWLDQPSLIEMTEKAIQMLSKNEEKGFFLLVEGGRIDHAHHDTYVSQNAFS